MSYWGQCGLLAVALLEAVAEAISHDSRPGTRAKQIAAASKVGNREPNRVRTVNTLQVV